MAIFQGSLQVGLGLLTLAFIADGLMLLTIAATFFAGGGAYVCTNMTGTMSERIPKAGSLGITLLIGFGFGAAGFSNAIMGSIADQYLPDALDEQVTDQVLESVQQRFPGYLAEANEVSGDLNRLAELGC